MGGKRSKLHLKNHSASPNRRNSSKDSQSPANKSSVPKRLKTRNKASISDSNLHLPGSAADEKKVEVLDVVKVKDQLHYVVRKRGVKLTMSRNALIGDGVAFSAVMDYLMVRIGKEVLHLPEPEVQPPEVSIHHPVTQ